MKRPVRQKEGENFVSENLSGGRVPNWREMSKMAGFRRSQKSLQKKFCSHYGIPLPIISHHVVGTIVLQKNDNTVAADAESNPQAVTS